MENLENIKAIFFDLDNTLIPTRKADKLACNKLNEILQTEYGFSNDDATVLCSSYLKKFRQCPDNPEYPLDHWRLKLFTSCLETKHQSIANEIFQKWLQLRYKYLIITPEIKSMLTKLKKNYFLAVISNGPSNAQWEKVNKMNLQSLFDLILISGDLPWEKPNTKIFHKAYTYLGVEPDQCMMIGDKLETDIIGAIEANLACTIWLPLSAKSYKSNLTLAPDLIIDKITDISKFLLKKTEIPRNLVSRRSCHGPDYEDCNSNGSDGS